jgi:hypothetical protein
MTPGIRGVQKIESEALNAETAERIFTRAPEPLRRKVGPPHLSDEMKFASGWRIRAAQGASDRLFVSVCFRKIKEAVASLQRDAHRLFDIDWRRARFVG